MIDFRLQRQSTSDMVADQIEDLIIECQFKMGEKLNTEDLAEQFGVSRMPVREALKKLEQQGFIEMEPYKGYRVVTLTPKDIYEIYIMRKAIEPLVAYYACKNITAEGLKNVVEAQTELRRTIENYPYDTVKIEKDSDGREIFHHNKLFHFSIYEWCDMDRMYELVESLWKRLSISKLIYGATYLHSRAGAQDMLREHDDYIELLSTGKAEELKSLMESYMEATRINVLNRLYKDIH